ncbi:hypothetical protein C8R47DRAFT_616854 [Mycena vitilis]|nr:hypothetical protein C8R47DRAFT_616854 [Mycena vitilis]
MPWLTSGWHRRFAKLSARAKIFRWQPRYSSYDAMATRSVTRLASTRIFSCSIFLVRRQFERHIWILHIGFIYWKNRKVEGKDGLDCNVTYRRRHGYQYGAVRLVGPRHIQLSFFRSFSMLRLRVCRSTSSEWAPSLVRIARGLVAVGNCVPVPYVSAALLAGLALLELIQSVGKLDEDLKYLAESVITIMKLLSKELDSHPIESPGFRQVCEDLSSQLTQLTEDLKKMSQKWSSSKLRKYLNSQNMQDQIAQFARRFNDLRANATLVAATGTRLDLASVANGVTAIESQLSALQHELVDQHYLRPMDSTDGLKQKTIRLGEDFHALKPGDIHLDFRSARPNKYGLYDNGVSEGTLSWTDYKATVGAGVRTVRVYHGSDPIESWNRYLSFFADNLPTLAAALRVLSLSEIEMSCLPWRVSTPG